MTAKARRSRHGYTLIEILVVTAISVLLMTVLAFIYANAMRVYNESQGIQDVYETAKIINRDLRDAFANVVAIPGEWVNPVAKKFPGLPDATTAVIDWRYINSGSLWWEGTPLKQTLMQNNIAYDRYFSGPHRPQNLSDGGWWSGLGYFRGGWSSGDAGTWKDTAADCSGAWAWWMPGFFGQRDGTTKMLLEENNIIAGSWGWPRPDYRMDIDLDDLANKNNMACWFYTENKRFHSPSTLTLDNSNIYLISIKFSRKVVANKEETQLSFLRHPIVGNDTGTAGLVREDQAGGNMLRAIKITPYTMDAGGMLRKMDDSDIGADLSGTPIAGQGKAVPRCFDIEYTLRNRANMQPYKFALRVYCSSNPQ